MRIYPASALLHIETTTVPTWIRITYPGNEQFVLALEGTHQKVVEGTVSTNVPIDGRRDSAPKPGTFRLRIHSEHVALHFDFGGTVPIYEWIFDNVTWLHLPGEFRDQLGASR